MFGKGGWHLGWRTTEDIVRLPHVENITFILRAAGKIYWSIRNSWALALDENMLGFLIVAFPDHVLLPDMRTRFRVVPESDDGGDATVRVVRVGGQRLDVLTQTPPGSDQWVVEKTVQLRDAAAGLPGWDDRFLLQQPARIVSVGDTFVVLTPTEETWLFSMDLETMELERDHERNRYVGQAYPCSLPWPPVLEVYLDQCGAVSKRRQRRNAPVQCVEA